MFKIESKIKASAPEFKENFAFNKRKIEEFRERLAAAKEGGPAKAIEKHKARGKLTARERLDKLFDKNTPFLEFSTLAANGMYKDEAPCAGIITGVGVVHGKEVLIVANDSTVKG
jgi:3-methylcrotonyl-CoA carboxylase beta subunit